MLVIDGVNYWVVLVAWLVNVGVGSFWYSPAGFAKYWAKLSGVDLMKIPKPEANRAIVAVAVSSLVQAFGLAVMMRSTQVDDVIGAVSVGLVLWLCFTAATTVGVTLYSRLSWRFWWLNSSFFLIVMTINSVLFGLFQQ